MISQVPWEVFKDFDPKDGSLSNHCELITLVHQIVANPSANHRFPTVPRTHDDFWGAIQYWDAAYYFLTVILGWSDPGLGLLWYYNNDKQDFGDNNLKVLKELWDNEDQLDLLAAWIFRYGNSQIRESQLTGVLPSGSIPPPMALQIGEWWTRFHRKYPNGKCPYEANPFFGGTNSLHLGHFDFVFSEHAAPASFFKSDPLTRTACLVIADCSGWYFNLKQYGCSLPILGDRSWHVDVFAKTIGYLGMYRQSRETGLWFHGKHSTHSVGNSHTLG